ncbi:DUF4843 domain-containing protein [Flavobacterium agrisoli]|uniref:DUF4843 domain-containing protein n=1 Tax=Flavobacterium agrisoli TaxID=2793066 RepID=A0A934UHZ6_9FLAO|nr:DUF4843 domain-containing protein [Flavobacterium agrisoli]MBK0368311.1 DUF4843 domain-containing protein [Flavobacterium agrisoli]
MKKIAFLSIVFLAILGFSSCSEDEIDTYKGTDNIYFSPAVYALVNNGSLIDSTGFSFGFDNESVTEKTYYIPIRVQGTMSNVDREVKVAIDPTSSAVLGTHFSLPENIVMRAGSVIDTIAVKVKRTPDMKEHPFTLVLNLEANENFATNMQSKVTNVLTQKTLSFTRFKLTFDDMLTQPIGWYVPYLGVFTAKKLFLMCDLMSLDPSMFNQNRGLPGLGISDFSYYRDFMKRYLADQKASGNTIYEDDGTEMYFP